MAWSFNPFTGNLDLVGGGAVVFEGEVETFADLPETIGDPAVGASFLVRSSTGVWLVNRRQAGIWIRRNNTGVRATDWEYGGDYPVNSVNGQTGNVSLTASSVGAAAATHASTHHTGGTDAIAPNQISAQWALETRNHSFFSTSTYTLTQGRNVQLNVNVTATNATGTVTLPRLTTDGAQNGDDLFIVASAFSGNTTLIIQRYIWTGSSYLGSTETVVTTTTAGAWRFRLLSGVWTLQPVATHTHTASQITDFAQAAQDYTVVSTPQTLTVGAKVAANTTAGAFTLTLPATPANGDTVSILDYAGTFDTNNLIIARNGSNIESLAEDMDCNIEDAAFSLVFVGSTVGWKVVPYFGNKTNFASPDPIGSSVANTGRFTTLTAGNGTITASAPVLDLSQTWNNAAIAFTGLRFDVTNTNSSTSSRLVHLTVGGTSNAVGIYRDASGFAASPRFEIGSAGVAWNIRTRTAAGVGCNFDATVGIGGSLQFGVGSGTGAGDIILAREAADTLALGRTTNPQTFRLYNTTDAGLTNFERGFLRWSSNTLQIGTEKAGTGSARALELQTDGTSYWQLDTSGRLRPVGEPGGAGFRLASGWLCWQQGSTNHFAFVDGNITARSAGFFQWSGTTDAGNFSGDWLRLSRSAGGSLLLSAGTSTNHIFQFGGTTNAFPALKRSSTTLQVRLADDSADAPFSSGAITTSGTVTANNTSIGFETSSAPNGASPVRFSADSGNVLIQTALNPGITEIRGTTATNPQTVRIFNTRTSSTNFERLNVRWASNECIIDAEAGSGGGTLRGIKIGSATTQPLGFWNATPAAQPAAVADATDAATTQARLNDLLARLRTIGIIAT